MGERLEKMRGLRAAQPWVPRVLGVGCALACALVSFVRFAGLHAPGELAACAAAFADFAAWLTLLARFGTDSSERAAAAGLVGAGLLALVCAVIPQGLVHGVLAAFAGASALLLAADLVRSPKPLSWPGERCPRERLTLPLAYLCAYVLLHALALGLLMCAFVEGSSGTLPRLSVSVGLLAAGALATVARSALGAPRGLSLLTRGCLLLLIVGSSALLLAPESGLSFGCLSCGVGLLLFLIARMSLDLREAFSLSPWMLAAIAALFAAGMAAGAGIGLLLFAAEMLPAAVLPVTLGCMLVVAAVSVFGLSSERVWVARDLSRLDLPAQPEARRALWREACQAVAADAGLTPRETDVFMLMAKGRNSAVIEKELYISGHTVKTHTLSIYRKLDVHSLQQLIDLVEERKAEME